MSLRVAFRADASVQMGIGHVMRCLTLADAVATQGGSCLFLCRPFEGHLLDAITQRGHMAKTLPMPNTQAYGPHPNPPSHANWLGGDWSGDAEATYEAASVFGADWLVVDHYALDMEWQAQALPDGTQLAVIDDLADRPHRAKVLLDQNYGRQASDYDGLVPGDCQRMIGPRYALLRPRFAELRAEALKRRTTAAPRHLLITLGGTDSQNATGEVLRALAKLDLPPNLHISVVMGATAPCLSDVEELANTLPRPTEVLVNVTDMAELILRADFCIGAGGSTTWERCCLGLPMALMVLAENQREMVSDFAQNGHGIKLDLDDPAGLEAQIAQIIALLEKRREYHEMVQSCGDLVDGAGVQKVLAAITGETFNMANGPLGTLRPVSAEDIDLMLEWRNDPSIREMMHTKHVISREEHLDWWHRQQIRNDVRHMIYEFGGQKDGVVSLSQINPSIGSATWAFYASPGAPRGTGSRMEFLLIEKAFFELGLQRLDCEVLEKNSKVKELHVRFGFKQRHKGQTLPVSEQSDEPFYQLSLDRKDWLMQRDAHLAKLLKWVNA